MYQYISVSFLGSYERYVIIIPQLSPGPSSLGTSHTSVFVLISALSMCKLTSATRSCRLLSPCPWASPLEWAAGVSDAPCVALGPLCSQLWPSSLAPYLSEEHGYSFRHISPNLRDNHWHLHPCLQLTKPHFYLLWIYKLGSCFSNHTATAFVWDLAISCTVYCNRLPIHFPQRCQRALSKNAILSCQSSF